MRLHTSVLTPEDFAAAAALAGCKIEICTEHGSKSRDRAFEVVPSGSGNMGGQFGSYNFKSATWDEWGILFNYLYELDPAMSCRAYAHRDHFHAVTVNRYRTLKVGSQHLRHRWRRTSASTIQSCACGGRLRLMSADQFWKLTLNGGIPAVA
jgi:hypothetical protein